MRQTSASLLHVQDLVAALGPGPWTVEEVLGHGWPYARIRAAVAAGRLVRPHRGVLAQPPGGPEPEGGSRSIEAEDAGRAALLVAGADGVLSHDVAGEIHGLWIPEPRARLVHVRTSGAVRRTDHGMRVRSAPLMPDEICTVRGMRVTTIIRTAIDLARGRPVPEALLPLDSAVRLLLGEDARTLREIRPDDVRVVALVHDLRRNLGRVRGWPGTARVWRALEQVDPRSESAFESRSRGWITAAGLPQPEIAFRVVGASGTTYFSDFGWEEQRVLGEADGFGKYGTSPEEVRRALRAERRRQRDLEDAGWTFVRWDTSEGSTRPMSRLRRHLT